MPKLRIYKKKSFFIGPANIYLLIDSKEIDRFKSDGKIETDADFGIHKIQVKSKYFSSTIKEFKMDVKKEIEIAVKFGVFFKITQIIFIVALSFSVFFESKFFFTISDIAFIAFLLTLFIKRKDFFIIKELN